MAGRRGFFAKLNQQVLDELYRRRHESVQKLYDWLSQQSEFHRLGGVSKKGLDYYIGKLRKVEKETKAKCVIASVVTERQEVSSDDFDTLLSLDRLVENTLKAALEHSEAVLDSEDKTVILKETHLKCVDVALAARERFVLGQRQILKSQHEERATSRTFANTEVWQKVRKFPPEVVTGILEATRKSSTPPQLKVLLEKEFGVVASLSEVERWIESFTRETAEAAILNREFEKYRGLNLDGVLRYCSGLLAKSARKLESGDSIEDVKLLTAVVKETRQLAAGYVETMGIRERAESEALGALKVYQALQPYLADFGASGAQFEALLKSTVEDLGQVKGLPPRET